MYKKQIIVRLLLFLPEIFQHFITLYHTVGEQAICIDHWAALIVDDDDYHIFSLPEKEGSVLETNGTFSYSVDRQGTPGVWVKSVVDNKTVIKHVPKEGKVSELFKQAADIVLDSRVEECRRRNPTPLYVLKL